MERIVIVGYRPFQGKELELVNLAKRHWETLKKENLVSPRKPVIVKSKDGTVIEIFGWKSKEAMEEAHSNEAVQKMWAEYSKVCEYVPFGEVCESQDLFSEFSPLDFD